MKTPTYTDSSGVGYDINRNGDNTWSVWCFHNKESGWRWLGSFPSESLAHSFMAWVGDFKEAS